MLAFLTMTIEEVSISSSSASCQSQGQNRDGGESRGMKNDGLVYRILFGIIASPGHKFIVGWVDSKDGDGVVAFWLTV